MNERILYQGKNRSGEWIFGDILYFEDSDPIIFPSDIPFVDVILGISEDLRVPIVDTKYIVDPKSVYYEIIKTK